MTGRRICAFFSLAIASIASAVSATFVYLVRAVVEPFLSLRAEPDWRQVGEIRCSDLAGEKQRSPAFARAASFTGRLLQRTSDDRTGAPLNVGAAGAGLAFG